MTRDEIFLKVRDVLVDALAVDEDEVTHTASLTGDLGAESIDFLDIVFRLETAFDLKIPEDEIWKGSAELASDDPAAAQASLARLKERTPGFRWDRFPSRPAKRDLPRLITVRTIVDYLDGRLGGGAEPA